MLQGEQDRASNALNVFIAMYTKVLIRYNVLISRKS